MKLGQLSGSSGQKLFGLVTQSSVNDLMYKSLKRLAIEILTRRVKNSGGLVTKSGGGIVWRMDTIDSEKDIVVVSTEMGVWRENHLLRLLRLRLFQESRYLIGMLSQKSLNDIGGSVRWH